MNDVALQFTHSLVTVNCFSCGIEFAMPYAFREHLVHDHSRSFYCPNGHQQHYVGETEAQKLRRQLISIEEKLAWKCALSEDRAGACEKKLKLEAARLRMRAANGVCPCCQRSFQNLRRHMTTKHPDYAV